MAVGYRRGTRVPYPSGTSAATSETFREREFLSELLIDVSPLEIPFTKLVGFGEAAENMKLEWQQDNHLPNTTTLASDLSAVPTSATATFQNLTVAANTGPYFKKGDVVRIKRVVSNAEQFIYCWVRDDPVGDVVPVVMNYTLMTSSDTGWPVSTVIATADATHEVSILLDSVNDGDDSPRKSTTSWNQLYNYIQISDRAFSVGHAQQQMRQYGVKSGGDYNREKMKTFEECYLALEKSCMQGLRVAPDTTNNYPAAMGGVQYFVTSNVTTMAGAAVTELKINDTMQAIYDSVGRKNMQKMTLICNSAVKRQISRLYSHASGNNYEVQLKREMRTGGVVVNSIETEFGDVDILLHKWCPKDRLYFLDLSKIKIVPLKNSNWFHENLSPQGAYTKGHIYGAFSLMVTAPECHGVLTNCSTTVT